MRKRRPLGIRQTLWLAIGLTVTSVALAAGALYRYQLHHHDRDAQRLRVKAIAEAYAAQVLPLVATGQRSEASSFVENVAWHPGSCLIAILDVQGRTVAARGNTPLLERYLKQPGTSVPGKGPKSWTVPGEPERSLPELSLVAVPLLLRNSAEGLGTLVYAGRVSRASNATAEEVFKFFAYLVLIAATGMVLGFLWLNQQVLKPLAQLARQAKPETGRRRTASLPTHRRDEIGELARALADMHLDLDEWRERVTRLERSVNNRVAAETQKITRELRQVQKKIWTDPLTRLSNRRLLDNKFADIFRAQQEADQDLSIVMIDLDHFKTLNDVLGHNSGDELLVFAGELLKQCLREQDLAVRYGGDEFLLILPSVAVKDARIVAERTVRMFAQQAKLFEVDPKPTMSAGIASLREHRPDTPTDLLELADRALYDAKSIGKSQVRVSKASGRVVVEG